MYLALVVLSFIGTCLAGLFGRQLGSWGAAIITTSCLFFSLFFSLFAFYEVALSGGVVYVKLATWISSETLNVDWGFMFDTLTVVMCVVVTFISSFVHLYSTEYMSHDPHLARFMCYLSLFTFFMLVLVTGDNLVQMFLGWEGIGLASYLLINFWFTRIQANKAAIKAMILNRIGDFCFVMGILLIFVHFKAVDYATLAILAPFLKNETINFLNLKLNLLNSVGFFLFLGAVGKSAQLGLHTWLPDAMEGPTPVSSLIHAATLVTAGVFLIARMSFIYEQTNNVLDFVVILGALTSFVASTTGLVQNDLKRVIAYSTCSQLGYMVFACGLSNYSVGIFHLSNHAFFKALLFLSAGSIIHGVNDEQDMRKLGGLKNLLPFTYSMMMIGSLALIGFPFLTGFYSKDLILEAAYGKYTLSGYFSYFLGTLGAFLTAFYSTRLLYLAFLAKPTGHKSVITFAGDSNIQICFALGSLAIPSIFVGYYTKDMMVGVGSQFFGTSIYTSIVSYNIFDAEFIPLFYKTLPVHFSLFGAFLAFVLYNFQVKILYYLKTSSIGKKVYNFLNRKWFFDKVYNEYLGQFFFKFAYSTSYKFVDRGVFEILGPTGLSATAVNVGSSLHRLQTGSLYHLTLTILVGITTLFSFRHFLLISILAPNTRWLELYSSVPVLVTSGYWFDYKLAILMFISSLFLISCLKSSDSD